MPLVASNKAKVKVSRGKISFNATYKPDLDPPYNPFSSSEEEEEEQERRGSRARGRNVAGQERRRAQLVTSHTMLLEICNREYVIYEK